jgi:alpha-L-rhamnosidase
MQAQWIEPVEADDLVDVQRPAHHLVGTFLADEVASAELRITAHGIYEAFLNGARVGDQELTPGFTAYRKRLQVQTYDVTALLREGDNALGVLLSDGWWRGQNGIGRRTNAYGHSTGLLAELTVTRTNGTRTVVGTDASWVSTPSHIEGADLVAGEIHDLRNRRDDWGLPGTDRSSWAAVRVVDHALDNLCDSLAPPVRRVQELPARSVTEVAPGRHVVDFGQVSNGWIRLTDLGPEGTRLTIVHGESLTPAGDDVDVEALAGGVNQHDPRWQPSFQTDVVVSAGDGSVFEPRHSTKGFRYVRIDGHPGPLEPHALTSVVVHNDISAVGSFACSDEDLNWLHTAAGWSLRTNLCDIPTDCPTRERAGWTGDWQIYVDTASYLYDVTDFSQKWLLDVAAEQLPSGAVLHFVPDPFDHADTENSWWTDLQGSAGWGDAIVHVPWELYRATGRTDVLKPYLEPMRRWVDFAAAGAQSGRHPKRAASRPEAAEHERFLWDTGFHFGEWNEPENAAFTPEANADPDIEPESGLPALAARLMAMDHGPTATAFLYRSADELARIADILGDMPVAEHYQALAADVLDAWRREFIDEAGDVRPATQPNLVRALAFGLVPEDLRGRAADQLVALVRGAGTHLGTGFLATPFLLPVLADNGYVKLAHELLMQRTAPSWLAMRDQGATTIWEGWHPFDGEGRVKESLNHFSMGAVVGFLHRYVAGLQVLEPGYRRFRVEPRPGAGLTWARTHHDSPQGRIEVSWRVEDGVGTLELTVPRDAQAEIVLPGREAETLAAGAHTRSWEVAALTASAAGAT